MSGGAEKTTAEDALLAKKTQRTTLNTAKATAETAFATAKGVWDTFENGRLATLETAATNEMNAQWTEFKGKVDEKKTEVDAMLAEVEYWESKKKRAASMEEW